MNRRSFLSRIPVLVGLPLPIFTVRAQITDPKKAKTKLILLGTGGGPRPRKQSSAAAQGDWIFWSYNVHPLVWQHPVGEFRMFD